MFQFPPFAYHPYFTQSGITGSYSRRVSSFRHIRIIARLAAPRTLSWPSPSFIASMSQGIHLVPWVAFHYWLVSQQPYDHRHSNQLTLRLFADLCFLKTHSPTTHVAACKFLIENSELPLSSIPLCSSRSMVWMNYLRPHSWLCVFPFPLDVVIFRNVTRSISIRPLSLD